MDKSPEAFRTISEVAETLDTPAHVLRFWESRFPQIRPVKRAGGRRYYRPADVALLTGIKRLLHEDGMTIRGVQKVLREQGVRHVSALCGLTDPLPDPAEELEAAMADRFGAAADQDTPVAEVETAQIFALETALRKQAQDRTEPPRAEPRPKTPLVVAETPDLFASLAPLPAEKPEVQAEPAVEPQAGPEPAIAELTMSRGARLRAMPHPLPDKVAAQLIPLRGRMIVLRDHLRGGLQAYTT
ncbi:MAG: MerR family transcriptional regulator [Paracoccaceae bacterium]